MKKFVIIQCATGFVVTEEAHSHIAVVTNAVSPGYPIAPAQPGLQAPPPPAPPPPRSPWVVEHSPRAYSSLPEVFGFIEDSLKPPEALPYLGDAETVLRYAEKHCEPKDIAEFLAAWDKRDMVALKPYLEWLNG